MHADHPGPGADGCPSSCASPHLSATWACSPSIRSLPAAGYRDWPGLHPVGFVGLKNFRLLLDNPMAVSAIKNTVMYVGIVVPVEVGLGVASAWVTIRRRHGQALLAILLSLEATGAEGSRNVLPFLSYLAVKSRPANIPRTPPFRAFIGVRLHVDLP